MYIGIHLDEYIGGGCLSYVGTHLSGGDTLYDRVAESDAP